MNKIDLIIKEKRAELATLELEKYEALKYAGDRDYAYVAILYPIMSMVEREIAKFEKLKHRPDPPASEGFEAQVWQMLKGPFQSLEIWVEIEDYSVSQTTRLLEIKKLKARNRISCTIRMDKCFQQYLHQEYAASILEHIGWQKIDYGKSFRRKTILKTLDDLETFCQWMSATMLDGLDGILRYSKAQYYRLRK